MTGPHSDATGNGQLAERALALAKAAGQGSPERRAALCAYVALTETRSLAAASVILGTLDHIAPQLLGAAVAVLDQVAAP